MIEVAFRHRQGYFLLDVEFTSGAPRRAVRPLRRGQDDLLNVVAGLWPIRLRTRHRGRAHAARQRCGRLRAAASAAHRLRVPGRPPLPPPDVRQNLLYGRCFHAARGSFHRLEEIAELLGIRALLSRHPGTLRRREAAGRDRARASRLAAAPPPRRAPRLPRRARKDETMPYIERLRDELPSRSFM